MCNTLKGIKAPLTKARKATFPFKSTVIFGIHQAATSIFSLEKALNLIASIGTSGSQKASKFS
jgi:hypothetical protein